ncbi:MAG: hypothetical protein U1F44_00555 [Coriobacteriia bacterium]|nr:hypothetical protein [Coriobacteriia bacterium]
MAQRVARDFDLAALLPAAYYCLDCAERLCAASREVEGIISSACDKQSGILTVSYDPAAIDAQTLEREIVRLGLEVVGAVGHACYRLTGLD